MVGVGYPSPLRARWARPAGTRGRRTVPGCPRRALLVGMFPEKFEGHPPNEIASREEREGRSLGHTVDVATSHGMEHRFSRAAGLLETKLGRPWRRLAVRFYDRSRSAKGLESSMKHGRIGRSLWFKEMALGSFGKEGAIGIMFETRPTPQPVRPHCISSRLSRLVSGVTVPRSVGRIGVSLGR